MADQSPQEREILLHGQRVSYRETGRGEGPTVLLVHGLAASSRTWAPVFDALGGGLHVIAPDLLGHGASEAPRSGDYSLGGYATGLRDLLAALDAIDAIYLKILALDPVNRQARQGLKREKVRRAGKTIVWFHRVSGLAACLLLMAWGVSEMLARSAWASAKPEIALSIGPLR